MSTNPNGLFWLARYAHNTLAPLMEGVGGRLQLDMDFGTRPGVSVWIHSDNRGVLTYGLSMSKESIDRTAAKLTTMKEQEA